MLKLNLLGAIFLTALSIAIPTVAQDGKQNMQGDNMMGQTKSTDMKPRQMSTTTKSKHRKTRKHKAPVKIEKM